MEGFNVSVCPRGEDLGKRNADIYIGEITRQGVLVGRLKVVKCGDVGGGHL